jgi:hypothetical protein
MQQIVTFTSPSGKTITRTNSYQEMASGMSAFRGGAWVPSSSQIQITPSGGAATNGAHSVFFNANVNTAGSVTLITPEGRQLSSSIAALCYFDGTTNVIIATPQDSIGQMLPSLDRVIYTNAFSGVSADVMYINSASGFDQGLLLREQPPPPSSFPGLTGSNIWLQLWTEFSAPAPQITETQPDGDETIDFGMMKMIEGKAFSLGESSNSIPVIKSWATASGRTFLIESVPLDAIAPQLNQLPAPSTTPGNPAPGSGAPLGRGPSRVFSAQARRNPETLPPQRFDKAALPAARPGKKKSSPMRIIKDNPAAKGLYWDYTIINGSLTNVTFSADETYYISGDIELYGTTTVEGGTIIKNGTPVGAAFAVHGTFNCLTSPYRPAIFTCTNDDTVGASLDGGNGTPAVAQGTTYLYLYNSGSVSNCHFRYGWNAFGSQAADVEVWDCQFIDCNQPVTALSYNTNVGIHNVLLTMENAINNTNNYAHGIPGGILFNTTAPVNLYCENLTANVQSQNYMSFVSGADTSSIMVSLTNSIVVAPALNPPYQHDGSAGVTAATNAVFYASSLPAGLFQTVGAGNYYLADDSPYRNAGTTNITPALLADLSQKTTYPPLWLTNAITVDTVLNPQAQRENSTGPDIGYGYDPVDFLSACMVSNSATLTLTNGVALAYLNNSYGIWLENGAQLISQGTPNQHNYLAHFALIQEQATNLSTQYTNVETGLTESMAINPYHDNASQTPSAYLRFTTLSGINGAGYVVFINDGNWAFNNLTLRDCEIYGAGADWYETTSASTPTEIFENNLFYRASIDVLSSGQLTTFNNLIVAATNANVQFANAGSSVTWTNQNNAFDGGNVYMDGTIGYNAYLNGAVTNNGLQSTDILTNLTWVTGPLSLFYQTNTSPLINAGSTSAANLGLYHYTTTTNQVPETNSVVDIGFHLVALGPNGRPLSTSGDGIGDYLKDSNGDGIYNAGDLGNWRTNNTAGDGMNDYIKYIEGRNLNASNYLNDTSGELGLQVYTPLK